MYGKKAVGHDHLLPIINIIEKIANGPRKILNTSLYTYLIFRYNVHYRTISMFDYKEQMISPLYIAKIGMGVHFKSINEELFKSVN